MLAWEYMTVSVESGDGNITKVRFVNRLELPNWKKGPYYIDYLNQLGASGWEVFSPNHWGEYHLGGFFLKRQKNQ